MSSRSSAPSAIRVKTGAKRSASSAYEPSRGVVLPMVPSLKRARTEV
ncbi:hypothetical protein [Sinomonas sp. P10A9]|uniref:Uncharacterized protein n=1 Tax=Sinomonas puerhi TaxID=3238584 RepID=A0AB39L6T6_9MICC